MVGVGVAFVVTSVCSFLLLHLGTRFGFVDRPDGGLKPHRGSPVPLGGVAVMLGLHAGLAIMGQFDVGLALGTGLVMIMGLVDDRFGLPPMARLVGTSLAALLVILVSDLAVGFLAIAAGILLTALAVNAVNLLDGLDALAATVCAVAAVGLALFAVVLSASGALAPIAMSGALAGFLLFNWPPARLYLGDNGAYVVGLVLAWSALRVDTEWATGLVAASLIGVPLLDLGVTVARRLRTGVALFAGDRDHTYDRLYRKTGSVISVVVALVIAQVVWSCLIIGTYVAAGVGVAITAALVVGLGCLAWSWISAQPTPPRTGPETSRARGPSTPDRQ